MEILKPEERKSLVEEICSRFHSDGILRLETIGHFEKYTPLYHFRIAEPNDEDFIFITELSGDVDIKPGLLQGGVRMQYHGNYEGLSKMIIQAIHNGMIAPHLNRDENRERVIVNPAWRLHSIGGSDEDRLRFDNSLRYISHVLKLITPETRRSDVYSETFSSTFYVI